MRVRVCARRCDVISSKTLLLCLNHLRRCINIDYAAALERCLGSSPLDDRHCGYHGGELARGTELYLRERVRLTENTVISDV